MNSSIPHPNQDHPDTPEAGLFFQQEASPYGPDRLEAGRGALPAPIRYLSHLIIWGSIFYVWAQPESNIINYIATGLLLLWSGYTLIAARKQWPPFP